MQILTFKNVAEQHFINIFTVEDNNNLNCSYTRVGINFSCSSTY